jgi:GT2 family glycosyltransferase
MLQIDMTNPVVPLTIGVPTYRREESLQCTLRQIFQLSPGAFEVIVVDQTPEHLAATEAMLEEMSRTRAITWIRQPQPNLCHARNQILREAKTDWVLFLDDDVLFEPELLARYWSEINNRPSGAYVGQVYQTSEFLPWMLEEGAIDRIPRAGLSHYRVEDRAEVDFLRGCNFVVERNSAICAGGFEEALFGSVYGDEMDFALRLLSAGGRIRFLADAWLVHLGAPTGGCRIVGNAHVPEWQKTYCSWLLLFRHHGRLRSSHNLYGGRTLPFLWSILRSGPLRRENVIFPWRWYGAWQGVLIGGWRGFQAARSGLRSPFMPAASR